MLSLDTAFCCYFSSMQHHNKNKLVQTLITRLSEPVFCATLLHASIYHTSR